MPSTLQKLLAGTLVLLAIFSMTSLLPVTAHADEIANVDVGVGVGDTSLHLTGKTSPNAYVTLRSNGAVIGTFNAGSSGLFDRSFPAQDPGITNLSLTARDTVGRTTDTISTQVNLQDHLPTDVEIFIPTSLSLNQEVLTAGIPLQLTGQTSPLSTVAVTLNNQTVGTTMSRNDGSWSFAVATTGLNPGTYQVYASVSDAFGEQSYPTSSYSFSVAPKELPRVVNPANPNVTPALVLTTPRINTPVDNAVLHQSAISIGGEGPVRTQIEIWNDGHVLGSVWSDSLGAWKLPLTITPGQYTIRARACNEGVCSRFSPTITFSYQTSSLPQQKLQASINSYVISGHVGNSVTLHLKIYYGVTPYQVTTTWGDGSTDITTLSKSDTILQHIYTKSGKYSGHIVVSDSNGRQELSFTVNIKDILMATSAPRTSWLFFILFVIFLLVLWALRRYIDKKTKHKKDLLKKSRARDKKI